MFRMADQDRFAQPLGLPGEIKQLLPAMDFQPQIAGVAKP